MTIDNDRQRVFAQLRDWEDAQRYRWARKQEPDVLLDVYLAIPGDPTPQKFDEAIDDAMKTSARSDT